MARTAWTYVSRRSTASTTLTWFFLTAFFLFALFFNACAAIRTDTEGVQDTGIPYFLPRTFLELGLEIKEAKPTPPSTPPSGSRPPSSASQGTVPGGGHENPTNSNTPGPTPDNPARKGQASGTPSAVATATASITSPEQKPPQKKSPAPPSVSITIAGHEVKLTMNASRWPDPEKVYYLRQTQNWLSNDEFNIKVNERGLLTNVNSVADDQTAQIITSIGAAVVGFGVVPAPPTGGPAFASIKEAGPVPAKLPGELSDAKLKELLSRLKGTHQRIAIPRDVCGLPKSCALSEKNLDVKQVGTESEKIRFNVTAKRFGTGTSCYPNSSKRTVLGMFKNRDQKGVMVRVAEPVRIDAEIIAEMGSVSRPLGTLSAIVLLPDCSCPFVIPLNRTIFARSEKSMVLADGVPTEVKTKSPSPILSVVRIPGNIAEETTKIIGNVISIRYGTGKSVAEETKAQLELQKQILQLRKDIEGMDNPADAQEATASP